MYCVLWRFDNWYIITCGDPINGAVYDNWFPTKYFDDDYYIIYLLCGNYTSLHCSMLSTHCVKATVPSIK